VNIPNHDRVSAFLEAVITRTHTSIKNWVLEVVGSVQNVLTFLKISKQAEM
jgi:hypothetical protein